MACQNGHQGDSEVVMDSLSVEEQSKAMLHSEDDYGFRWAYENGHQKIAEWLFDFYKQT